MLKELAATSLELRRWAIANNRWGLAIPSLSPRWALPSRVVARFGAF